MWSQSSCKAPLEMLSGSMIWVKKHGKVLAACDEKILGKKFKEENLELHVKEDFYKGKLVSGEEFSKMIDEMENINLVGEEAVRIAEEKSLIADVRKINNIPHALIIKI